MFGRRWTFKQDEVDKCVHSGGSADKSDKPDTGRKGATMA